MLMRGRLHETGNEQRRRRRWRRFIGYGTANKSSTSVRRTEKRNSWEIRTVRPHVLSPARGSGWKNLVLVPMRPERNLTNLRYPGRGEDVAYAYDSLKTGDHSLALAKVGRLGLPTDLAKRSSRALRDRTARSEASTNDAGG